MMVEWDAVYPEYGLASNKGLQRAASHCSASRAWSVSTASPILCSGHGTRRYLRDAFEFMLDEIEPEPDVELVETGT